MQDTTKWRIDKNTYIPIKDMEPEHIQKAIYFSENKLKSAKESQKKAEHNFNLFLGLRDSLMTELSDRGLNYESLIESGNPEFKGVL